MLLEGRGASGVVNDDATCLHAELEELGVENDKQRRCVG